MTDGDDGVVATCLPSHNEGTDTQGHSLQSLHKPPCGQVPVPSLHSKQMDHLDGIQVCIGMNCWHTNVCKLTRGRDDCCIVAS